MTRTAKTITAAALAFATSIALMLLMQAYGPYHAYMFDAGSRGPHPATAMWGEMGWMMALGPVAMMLFFGSIVTFIVLLVRSGGKQG